MVKEDTFMFLVSHVHSLSTLLTLTALGLMSSAVVYTGRLSSKPFYDFYRTPRTVCLERTFCAPFPPVRFHSLALKQNKTASSTSRTRPTAKSRAPARLFDFFVART
jgi:hypothetical protein